MEKEAKKVYTKPDIQKHKAIALVSGSGCGVYTFSYYTYYYY